MIPPNTTVVSSANIKGHRCFGEDCYVNYNKIEPSLEPWGTPFIGGSDELLPLQLTYYIPLVKYYCNIVELHFIQNSGNKNAVKGFRQIAQEDMR